MTFSPPIPSRINQLPGNLPGHSEITPIVQGGRIVGADCDLSRERYNYLLVLLHGINWITSIKLESFGRDEYPENDRIEIDINVTPADYVRAPYGRTRFAAPLG